MGSGNSQQKHCKESNYLANIVKQKYICTKKLGDGMTGDVFYAISIANRMPYALKVINLKRNDRKAIDREIAILKSIHHPHILKYVEHFQSKEYMFLVTDIVLGGELFDAIIEREHYSEHDAREVVYTLLRTLEYLHFKNIVHCDLKPENIMLKSKDAIGDVTLIDFGLAQNVAHEKFGIKEAGGTPSYVAPECLAQKPDFGKPSDVWSIGVITYILLCGYPPFYGETEDELFKNITSCNYTFDEAEWGHISDEAKHFIISIFNTDPTKRKTPEQLFEMPWMLNHHMPQSRGVELEKAKENIRKIQARKRLKAGVDMVLFINRTININKMKKLSDKNKIVENSEEIVTDNREQK